MTSSRRRSASADKDSAPQTRKKAQPEVRVTLVRSTIGFHWNQELVVRGIGLRRLGQTVVVRDTPAIRGMIHKVRHLVRVEA